jgi:UDP-glucose:(glucosyl)LPS beta-1,3-glucosyltransferase
MCSYSLVSKGGKMVKVSIIMPAYNVENFIKNSVLSIQNQSFTNWELIIVNDGSTDDTLAVVEKIKNYDKRIQLYSQPNKGVSVARNLGISIAAGSLIAFLDADDLWHPLFLSSMINALATTKKKLAICGFNRLYPNGSYVSYTTKYQEGAILLPAVQNQLTIHIGSLLVSKELVDRFSIRFTENCMISEDVEFIYKLLAVTEAAVVQAELMTYRKRLGSTTQDCWKWKPYITSIYAMERVLQFTEKHYEKADKQQVVGALTALIRYLKCDFLWKGLKFGEHTLIRDLMNTGWREDLKSIHLCEVKLSKRLKYYTVLADKPFLWKNVHIIHKWLFQVKQQITAYRQQNKK